MASGCDSMIVVPWSRGTTKTETRDGDVYFGSFRRLVRLLVLWWYTGMNRQQLYLCLRHAVFSVSRTAFLCFDHYKLCRLKETMSLSYSRLLSLCFGQACTTTWYTAVFVQNCSHQHFGPVIKGEFLQTIIQNMIKLEDLLFWAVHGIWHLLINAECIDHRLLYSTDWLYTVCSWYLPSSLTYYYSLTAQEDINYQTDHISRPNLITVHVSGARTIFFHQVRLSNKQGVGELIFYSYLIFILSFI